ncbi:hypothetical protein B0H11DRAFT_1900569 [Mycena galericulata]|nr:hypothetical protein B0H11DRAFT_1900569 [Mycena galericulata]
MDDYVIVAYELEYDSLQLSLTAPANETQWKETDAEENQHSPPIRCPRSHFVRVPRYHSAPAAAAASKPAPKDGGKIEGAVQIAISVKKEVDFPAWYTNVLLKADMLDYYSVSGCYILKPW